MNTDRNLITKEVPDTNTRLEKELEKLKEKVNEFERNQRRPFVRIASLFNPSRLVTTEQRLNDGVTRFIEKKLPSYGMEREIYANYVEYYDDISRRMVEDNSYHYGNYLFMKSQKIDNLNDIEKWPRDCSAMIVLHPKEERNYLQLIPASEKTWSTKNVTEDYYHNENDKKYLIVCCIKTKYTWKDIGITYCSFAVIVFLYIFYACSSIYFTLFPSAAMIPILCIYPGANIYDNITVGILMPGMVGAIYMMFKVSLYYGIALLLVLVALCILVVKLERLRRW